MTSVTTPWRLTGDYFENCNSGLICPCLFSARPQLTARPTQGVYDVAIAVHIERGRFDGAMLDGLNGP
jgi:hypothetical protein